MASYSQLAKRLQSAINQRTETKLLINTQQWFSKDKGRTVTCFIVRQSMETEDKKRATVELFKTYSQIQLVLWLRDYWYSLNGWEVPRDNAIWEEAKTNYAEA